MFTLKIENANGEIFELTHNTQNYAVVGVQGLTPPPTAINTSTGGALDGTFFNSARVQQRNLVIDVILQGDIEGNRQRLYKIFPRKLPCTVYFKNKKRDVKIQGYVEVLDGDLFVQREQMQISIICPRPFFEAMEAIYTELSWILAAFEFPFFINTNAPIPFSEYIENPVVNVQNSGDVESGCIILVNCRKQTGNLKIYNVTKQEYFGLNYTFVAGDQITINTMSGQLSATLNRGGTITNLLNYVESGSTWFKLAVGDNDFTFTSGVNADSVEITFETSLLFGGV